MRLAGGEALAYQLAMEGITDVFGIPGVQLDWAVEGLRKVRDRVRFIVPRHEQAASYMADGYARSTDRIGTCLVMPGPGLLNAMSGLATAYACSSRVLCVAGEMCGAWLGKQHGHLHEVEGQSEILGSVTKWHGRARSPQDIPTVVREAFRQLRTGRPRPVGIEIAHDVLSTFADIDLIQRPTTQDRDVLPDGREIAAAAALLESATFPVIYAGGGVIAARASLELADLADKLQAPVVMSERGRGGLSDRHPLALNTLGGRAVFPLADVVLVVGSRFIDVNDGAPSWPVGGKHYIYLNAEPADWSPPRMCDVGVHADVRLGLAALSDEVTGCKPSRAYEMERVRERVTLQARGLPSLFEWVQSLRRVVPEDGFVVMDLTQVGYFVRLMYPVYEPYSLLTPGYQGTLGYGFPAGLGVAVGNPSRTVVCVTGDGGFGFNMQELATARKYDLGLVTIVFNDNSFGNVSMIQKERFGEEFGADLWNPRFDKLAEAFDVPSAQVNTPAELESATREAISRGGPALIEARVGEFPNSWHMYRLRQNVRKA